VVLILLAGGPQRPGNLWFTEFCGDRIGRLNPWTGIITVLAPFALGTFAVGITAGPDDKMWFTEYNGNVVGRLTLKEGGYR